MRVVRTGALLITTLLTAVACDGSGSALAPDGNVDVSSDVPGHLTSEWKHGKIPLVVRDQCDPATFNQPSAAGPGDCIATPTVTHRVTFGEGISQLQAHHNIRGWFNNPGFIEATPGSFIDALNTGGEVHTFTRVAKYGGGIVPILNTLSGNLTQAPECLSLPATEFLAPNDTDHEILPSKPGLYHYECCIHPWMRTDVLIGMH